MSYTIRSFDLAAVELGPGPLRDQYQQTRDYFSAIPDDDILFGFRQRAGLPSPGKPMGGWYSGDDRELWYSDGGGADSAGQWLSAFARMAKANHDQAMRDKALHLMREWARTIAPDGFCGSLEHGGGSHVNHYVFDKLCGGLVDVAHYLEEREALAHLATITRWAMHNLGRVRWPAGVHNFAGQTPTKDDGEWYTLSENLYRAYELTGDAMYRDFAQVWHYPTFWRGLARGVDLFPDKHAYSHVNSLSSAAMTYAVTGEQEYLKTITAGSDILRQNHLYATGGFGPRETFGAAGGSLSRSLWDNTNWCGYRASFETPCGCWAAFKLCGYLTRFTGAATYGDWVERLVYNGIGAALPMAGYGETFYYSDYHQQPGASKQYYPEKWPCCSGTFPLAVTEYHNLIYYQDATGLYINLFVPSKVSWHHGGTQLEVVQETRYPESEEVRVTVNLAGSSRFALRFRVPGWLSGTPAIAVNGRSAGVVATPGCWATIDREWHGGDTVELVWPMKLAFVPVEPIVPHQAALTIGPVVLVCDRGGGRLAGDRNNPSSWILATDEPLTHAVRGDPARGVFRPYYRMAEGQTYWMYNDIL